jgi:hypothetical protein
MRFDEAQALKPGTLLAVRDDVLDDDPEDNEHYALRDVVATHGYLYRFTHLLENDHYPVQATSLVTGKHMEFFLNEVDAAEEGEGKELTP